MYCPDCGHNNPEGNKFCGMCGEPLPDRLRASEKIRRERVAQHDPEPVPATFRHREPIDEPVRTRETQTSSTYGASSQAVEPATPTEQPGVSGPSFLGLGSTGDSSSGYSYLYEDEAPSSHAGLVVFLICLVALGGVVYWKWQPLRDWVMYRAQQKVDVGAPAPMQGSSTASSDNAAPASSAQPGNQQATPQNDSAQPANPPAQNGAAPADNPPNTAPSSAPPKDESNNKTAKPPAGDTTEKDSAPAAPAQPAHAEKAKKPVEEARKAEKTRRTSSEPLAEKTTERPAGDDLVASGERYLYGHGAPQNCQQALINFNAAAKAENPRAMAHLGALYATGECVPLNRVEAYHWFSRALAKDRSNTYLENNMTMLWREMDAREKAQVTGEAKEAQNKMF